MPAQEITGHAGIGGAIVAGLLLGMFQGVASGYLPARRAAEMNPVDALRYE